MRTGCPFDENRCCYHSRSGMSPRALRGWVEMRMTDEYYERLKREAVISVTWSCSERTTTRNSITDLMGSVRESTTATLNN
jgi:hypothetical protein